MAFCTLYCSPLLTTLHMVERLRSGPRCVSLGFFWPPIQFKLSQFNKSVLTRGVNLSVGPLNVGPNFWLSNLNFHKKLQMQSPAFMKKSFYTIVLLFVLATLIFPNIEHHCTIQYKIHFYLILLWQAGVSLALTDKALKSFPVMFTISICSIYRNTCTF